MSLSLDVSVSVSVQDVVAIAEQAATVILEVYQSQDSWEVEHKADASPLTRADREANAVICAGLSRIAPHIPIVSEENKQVSFDIRKGYQYNWCVDPLDGTKEFLKRNGQFTINIALLRGGTPILGVVQVPVDGTVYWAVEGQGASVRDAQGTRRLHCAEFDMAQRGLIVVASASHLTTETRQFVERLDSPSFKQLGSSLKLLMVAEGKAHLYPRLAPTCEWDTAAAHAVVLEAGGEVLQAGRCDSKGAALEDWQAALAEARPLVYNKPDTLNPFFVEVERDAKAVNELLQSLGEDELSQVELALDGQAGKAAFSVKGAHFELVCLQDGPCSLSGDLPGLDKANAKLSQGGGLLRALVLAGRVAGADLTWVVDAVEGGAAADNDEEMADASREESDEEGDDEVLREWSRRLVKVEKIEREIEAREDEAAATSSNLDVLQQRQIFDSKAAFRRLANELEEIFKAQQHDFNMVAEASDAPDGLYRWDVHLGGFSGPLAEDLQQAGRKFGGSSVRLQLVFKRPLHPFYPPSVRLSWPRFQGPILSAVASHPLFTPRCWDPMLTAREVLLLLKAFLEEHARVDLGSARNATSAAFLPAEQLLARLEALTGAGSACQQDYKDLYETREAQVAQKGDGSGPAVKKQKSNAAAAWKVWDARKAEAVQAARDAELSATLDELAGELESTLSPSANPLDRKDCIATVLSGCLAPFLAASLSSTSFQDMCSRQPFYAAILRCTTALCQPATARLLTWTAPGDTKAILPALVQLKSQASHFVRVFNQAASGPKPAGGSGKRQQAHAGGSASAELTEEDRQELELANQLLGVAAQVEEASSLAADGGGAAGRRLSAANGAAASDAGTGPSGEEACYHAALAPIRVRITEGVKTNHSFAQKAAGEATQPKARIRRVGRELASCESDLPISCSSSVFVVADESCSHLWKALITGPMDTPYAGGCFLFDIYFPPDYPRVSPNVVIRTTGGGSVRFNPNLYAEGKVCLSLLGTWQGSRGETWNAEYSTILQVLVSIQSLILVDEPWYNEPGYEQRADASRSNAYSADLMPKTITWAMLDMLQHPPPYFKDVIERHFRLRGQAVLASCRSWVGWCRERSQGRAAAEIEALLPRLEAQIGKLGGAQEAPAQEQQQQQQQQQQPAQRRRRG
eukprot:scaffold27.g5986.t1